MEPLILAEFSAPGHKTLPELCRNLWEEQIRNWPELARAHSALARAQTRSVACGAYEVVLQFNPARVKSSGAAVDKKSVSSRPCFLCPAHFPAGQKGILYCDDFFILCNPAPVLTRHFTVVHRQHVPQNIQSSFTSLLKLTGDLAPRYTLLYNGPACGASAPDHLHFQAVPSAVLPLEQSFAASFAKIKDGSVNLYRAQQTDRSIIALRGTKSKSLLKYFHLLMKSWQKINPGENEPKVNVLCSYEDGTWQIIVFLRALHRPAAFFAANEQRIFVSPGALDMAGLMITPFFADFQNLTADQIRGIYREVSATKEDLNLLINELKG